MSGLDLVLSREVFAGCVGAVEVFDISGAAVAVVPAAADCEREVEESCEEMVVFAIESAELWSKGEFEVAAEYLEVFVHQEVPRFLFMEGCEKVVVQVIDCEELLSKKNEVAVELAEPMAEQKDEGQDHCNKNKEDKAVFVAGAELLKPDSFEQEMLQMRATLGLGRPLLGRPEELRNLAAEGQAWAVSFCIEHGLPPWLPYVPLS
mmetsp:Transcript_77595/g.217771  ORF Transcript_77595/g.217771 Transcript_77595/m.217771 type:complete len:206 (+) Transcript_77595:169-786(+)